MGRSLISGFDWDGTYSFKIKKYISLINIIIISKNVACVAGLKSLADHEQSVQYKSTTIKILWPGPNVIKLFTAVIYEC